MSNLNDSLQQIICCLGHPVAGNPTQYVMDRALRAAGLDARCLTLDVAPEDLPTAVDGIRVMGFLGAVIAAPHERTASECLPAADTVTSQVHHADLLFRNETGELVAESTIGQAFLEVLGPRMDPAQKRILLLDHNPVALAMAARLIEANAAAVVILSDESEPVAEPEEPALTGLRVVPLSTFDNEPQFDVIVRPVWDPAPSVEVPIAALSLPQHAVVADFAFLATASQLLDAATEVGCPAIGGLEILCRKLAIAFRRWTAVEPDLELMHEALEEFFVV